MALVYLNTLAHGRSGDKGDISNVCVFSRDPGDSELLKRVLTPERVKALGGGATHSLRLDSLGKSMGSAFMRMKVDTEW